MSMMLVLLMLVELISSMFLLFYLCSQFLISKHFHGLSVDQSHHLPKALLILYESEKNRVFESTGYDIGRIKNMSDLSYLDIAILESSIARLQNLEVLLVHVLNDDIPTYLLNMPMLRHLRVGSSDIPARFSKNCDRSRTNSLQTLYYVCIYDSEDEEIIRRSPNLRRLKCQSPCNRCPDLNFLSQLESLTIYGSAFEGNCSVNFPKNIKKLTLSGISLPWENMSLIATLPFLEILKLECEAFIGEIWDTKDDEFQKLKFLKLYRIYIEQWNSSRYHFPVLTRLVLRSCTNLETIPSEFSFISTLQKIEVDDCSINVKNSALQIHDEQKDYSNEEFDVTIYSVWE
ncbi:putative late blight resistance protein homolog R1A-10 [Olea europaea var. sylvestris]|uniref:putative late blight resistance protein homolog R1A-10 n=1 Tax=Olea europaea var. sylvestris TaxID=158386 RepID=UPI000C1CE801|nr:putative late blight resistance protein homolog R1A-10 [Olea europaea var. sylvestris]